MRVRTRVCERSDLGWISNPFQSTIVVYRPESKIRCVHRTGSGSSGTGSTASGTGSGTSSVHNRIIGEVYGDDEGKSEGESKRLRLDSAAVELKARASAMEGSMFPLFQQVSVQC